ncbi:hypothetical protein FUT69_04080 [Xylella taiwanensis]|uniref:Uncharacterized protein n=1 Tax=Xylella taiwanensis TaxID=1444770 RepID=A0ABS8TSW4_9GAMM|nr:hypothetical protein [Xylella taiwanensis]MCD8455314.1 hypothetical protein [Xylella taiwanensis]MCD8457719.1 hypothetical protein [Xylella taiwanensis]MCD8459856.1 hypothetical protein [Xylella taiwanensis]MCD8464084.1 hypothetical protein [Xylella taiwanensis]MCD8464361.1 hypothetical protein [Xylella taiwanensis]
MKRSPGATLGTQDQDVPGNARPHRQWLATAGKAGAGGCEGQCARQVDALGFNGLWDCGTDGRVYDWRRGHIHQR